MLNYAKKLLVPLVVVALGLLVAKLMLSSRDAPQSVDAQVPLQRVQTTKVHIDDVPVSVVAHGNVTAKHELELASEVTGSVVWVAPNFEPGELVERGQVLLKVEPTNYRLALAEAKAALASADMALADAKALKRTAAIAEGKLNIEAARQRIAKTERDLSFTEIKSPFNAVIDVQSVELGQFISAGQTVARLLSSDTAEISLPIPASESGFLEAKANTKVVLSARIGFRESKWEASVLRIESRVDPQTRVIPVVVEVAKPYDLNIHDHVLPLGLFVKADIPGTAIPNAVRVPSSAVQADSSVFVLSEGALERRQVNIVHREGDRVVVNDGLAEGDELVITRLDVMFEGMKVERIDA
ncbi:MAG: efflux RND transporter periplasmic adaptor subunit [Halioglobus sp.]